MTGRLEGKIALITGAARGQGRNHAIRMAEEGADIIVLDLCDELPNVAYASATEADLQETVREVEARDRRVFSAVVDVRDRAAMREAIDAGVAELGGLDIVVANAGVMVASAWDDVTEDIWDQIIDTNLKGVWNTASLTAQHLIERGGGSMILVSSAAGLKAQPFLSAYVASKHGVVGLMRAFAVELAQHSIRVNSLHPAGVDTPMGTADRSRTFTPLVEKNPELGPLLKNLLPVAITQLDDQSNAVLFLASDESRYVTASTFSVDAGNTQF